MLNNINDVSVKYETKSQLSQPVYSCVFCIVLLLESSDVDSICVWKPTLLEFDFKMGLQNNGLCRKVVAIRRWSLTLVYFKAILGLL